jgi:hypothetical protein
VKNGQTVDLANSRNTGYNIRIPEDALHSMGRDSVPLADGSGDYWGIFTATHNLHCLVSSFPLQKDII